MSFGPVAHSHRRGLTATPPDGSSPGRFFTVVRTQSARGASGWTSAAYTLS